MKKGKYFICILLLLLVVGAIILFIRFFPCYKGAKFLRKNVDLQKMSYDITLTLSEEKLPQQQKAFVETLAKMTGISKEDLMVLRLQGSSQEGIIYVQITPRGAEKPVVELYLTDDKDLLNGAMLYDTVRSNLIKQFRMADLLLPKWNGGEYVSLEQAEQMFDLDLSKAKSFQIASYEELFSFEKYFALLVAANYEKREDGSAVFLMENTSAQADSALLQLSLYEDGEKSLVFGSFLVENMQQTLQELNAVLSGIGVETSIAENIDRRVIESLQGEFTIGQEMEIQTPDTLIQQDTVDKIATIKTIMQELLGR